MIRIDTSYDRESQDEKDRNTIYPRKIEQKISREKKETGEKRSPKRLRGFIIGICSWVRALIIIR